MLVALVRVAEGDREAPDPARAGVRLADSAQKRSKHLILSTFTR